MLNRTRWWEPLQHSQHAVRSVLAAALLLASAAVAAAQVPMPGYVFAEVTDETDKPVTSATTVVYDQTGSEVGSSATNSKGSSALIVNTDAKSSFIVRVLKSGYQTYEGRFETTGQYRNFEIKIKLVPLSHKRPATRALRAPPSRATTRTAPATGGLSPPGFRVSDDVGRKP